MAAAGPAAKSSPREDLDDIYSDLNQNEDSDKLAESNDLFDAVLTGAVNQEQEKIQKEKTPKKENNNQGDTKASPGEVNKPTEEHLKRRFSLYIGNFSWWTSDNDIMTLALRLGVKDIIEIKFAENRLNGQSRGFAEVVVTSEESVKTLLEKVPQCDLNGDRVQCRFATTQNLTLFEDVAHRRIPLRPPKESKDSNCLEKSSLLQEPSPPPVPSHFPPYPLPNTFPSMSAQFSGQIPSVFPYMPSTIPPPPLLLPPPLVRASVPPPGLPPGLPPPLPPPSLHINPAFFPTPYDGHSSKSHNQQRYTPQNTESDSEELMNRNRVIASSAISKAISGAANGDIKDSMETLLTAIAIIKQSRVYRDDRCQALVTSLKDCLVSIKRNYEDRKRSHSRDKDRDRGRDRDRHDSYSREGSGSSRRHRDGSWSRERSRGRSRDRSRDRDRQREHRDRYH